MRGSRHVPATLLLAVAALVAASLLAGVTAQSTNCPKVGKPCTASFPFCNRDGRCTSMLWDGYIDNGCQQNASYQNACVGRPRCKSTRIEFDNQNQVPRRDKYLGNPDEQPFIDEIGNTEVKDGNLILKMRYNKELKAGQLTRVTSSRWVHYGTYSARVRMSSGKGFVYTWIFKSNADRDDTGDEIDFEWLPGKSNQQTQSNWFYNGTIDYTKGAIHDMDSSLDVWHTYTMNYAPGKLEWLIDDKVVRTVLKNATLNTPFQEGRLFASIWDTCGNGIERGTQEWAGGPSQWCGNAPDTNPEYRMLIDWIDIKCAEGYEDFAPLAVPKVTAPAASAPSINAGQSKWTTAIAATMLIVVAATTAALGF
ncbi:putative glycosidase CRH2 [Blastocladiella emersonii ATCC 22665]|nr:putative glycosidase CRH2 [Blastocladiella emersonii ATCC 22665]